MTATSQLHGLFETTFSSWPVIICRWNAPVMATAPAMFDYQRLPQIPVVFLRSHYFIAADGYYWCRTIMVWNRMIWHEIPIIIDIDSNSAFFRFSRSEKLLARSSNLFLHLIPLWSMILMIILYVYTYIYNRIYIYWLVVWNIFYSSIMYGIILPIDSYFSRWLRPPTSMY